jgi:RHS repeat-associated protein
VRKKFTGYERDNETDLDFAQARYHNFALGRFSSPDPENYGADEGDPQSWNGYSYSRNNPHLLVDPDGKEYVICAKDGTECHTYSDKEVANMKNDPLVGNFVGDFNSETGLYSGVITEDEGNVVATVQQTSIDSQVRRMARGAAPTLDTFEWPIYIGGFIMDLFTLGGAGHAVEDYLAQTVVKQVVKQSSATVAKTASTAVVKEVSKRNLKHIAKHLAEFQQIDPTITLEQVVEIGQQIAAKGTVSAARASNPVITEVVQVGGRQVIVKVVLNSEGGIRSIYPLLP